MKLFPVVINRTTLEHCFKHDEDFAENAKITERDSKGRPQVIEYEYYELIIPKELPNEKA